MFAYLAQNGRPKVGNSTEVENRVYKAFAMVTRGDFDLFQGKDAVNAAQVLAGTEGQQPLASRMQAGNELLAVFKKAKPGFLQCIVDHDTMVAVNMFDMFLRPFVADNDSDGYSLALYLVMLCCKDGIEPQLLQRYLDDCLTTPEDQSGEIPFRDTVLEMIGELRVAGKKAITSGHAAAFLDAVLDWAEGNTLLLRESLLQNRDIYRMTPGFFLLGLLQDVSASGKNDKAGIKHVVAGQDFGFAELVEAGLNQKADKRRVPSRIIEDIPPAWVRGAKVAERTSDESAGLLTATACMEVMDELARTGNTTGMEKLLNYMDRKGRLVTIDWGAIRKLVLARFPQDMVRDFAVRAANQTVKPASTPEEAENQTIEQIADYVFAAVQ